MAFERKPGPAVAISIIGQVPNPPPKVPPDMVKRFPSLQNYEEQVFEWWGRFCDMLQRDRGQIQTQFQTDEAAAKSNLTTIQQSLDVINTQLSTITGSGFTTQFASLIAQVAAIVANLAMHISSTKVHGTTGDVVGDTDSQALENKSIGLNNPGYGRFTSLMLADVIPAGVTVAVPVGYTMLIGPAFEIGGTLKIEGTLVAV